MHKICVSSKQAVYMEVGTQCLKIQIQFQIV
jgi:hypothetical protein